MPVFADRIAISSCALYFSSCPVWRYYHSFCLRIVVFSSCSLYIVDLVDTFAYSTEAYRRLCPLLFVSCSHYDILCFCYVVHDYYVCFVQPLWYFVFQSWRLCPLRCICRSIYDIVLCYFVFGFADFELIASYRVCYIICRRVVCRRSV